MDNLFLTYPGVETDLLFLPLRFPELEYPGFSKALRTAAFAYPFLFDNLPLFYRVRAPGLSSDRPNTLTSSWLSVSNLSSLSTLQAQAPGAQPLGIPSPTKS